MSLHSTLLDHPDIESADMSIARLNSFTDALSVSIQCAWRAHRDAYLVHGDASSAIGTASRVIYTYVRHTLKVPSLVRRILATPPSQAFESEGGVDGMKAPTAGSFTGAVYRAMSDGTLAKIAVDLLGPSLFNTPVKYQAPGDL